MKPITLFFLIIVIITPKLMAQAGSDFIGLVLEPDKPEKKEISIASNNSESFNVWLEFLWKEKDNRIQIKLDRKDILEEPGDHFILCLPLMKETVLIKNIEECNIPLKKSMWNGKMAKGIKNLDYFMESNNLKAYYSPCYERVALNNDWEHSFDIIDAKEKISVSFKGLYVLKNEKKRFSSRNMKLDFKAQPIKLEITLYKKDPYPKAVNIVNELKSSIEQLKNLKSEAEIAKKAKKNSELKNIQNIRIKDFPEVKPEWDIYPEYQDIVDLRREYEAIRGEILNIKIELPIIDKGKDDKIPPCRLEEINILLKTLQMDIYEKKGNKKNYDSEKKAFNDIKNTTQITPNCKEDVVTAYKSYCKNIEKAINDK